MKTLRRICAALLALIMICSTLSACAGEQIGRAHV